MHAGAPGVDDHVPEGQETQLSCDASPGNVVQVPVRHLMQLDCDEAATAVDQLPAAHSWQTLDGAAEILDQDPAGH